MKSGVLFLCSGLGDILFSQKIAHYIESLGYTVHWPVLPQYGWLSDYIDNYNFISDSQSYYIRGQGLIIPEHVVFPGKEYYSIDTDTQITEDLFFYQGFRWYRDRHPLVMKAKYDMIDLDFEDWRDYIKFTRNKSKEDSLYYDVLGLKDGEEYVFVNRQYGTFEGDVYNKIPTDKSYYGCRVIDMSVIPGYSIFDWCKVLENCREINMVETALNYLLESPALFDSIKAKKLTLHHRNTGTVELKHLWCEVDYLFKLPWTYIMG